MPLLPLAFVALHLAAAPMVPAESTSSSNGGVSVPMPPPPAGARELSPQEREALLREPQPDSPEVSDQVEAQSAELEALRALEDVALDPAAQRDAQVRQALHRLGYGNPLRQMLQADADGSEWRMQDEPLEMPAVTDLASFDVSLVKDRYDIPVEMQPLVADYVRFFQGSGRKWFARWMSRATRYVPMMRNILGQKGVPTDTVYLAMIESGFSPQAYSWAHASGPWQFISETGKRFGLKQDFWVDERRDPVKATYAAAAYLKQLYGQFGHWYLAWAGYNSGGGKVSRMVAKGNSYDFWKLSEGKGFAKETKHYVPKLIAAALVAKHPAAFGFKEEEFQYLKPLEYDEVKLEMASDLEVLARAAEISVDELRELNPELKRWCTPPASSKEPYALRLPKGTVEKFTANFSRIAPSERLAFKPHRVKRGDTLSAIAAKYNSAPEAIMRLNGLKSYRALRINTDLVVPVPTGNSDRVFDRQVARARRTGFATVRPEEEIPAGTRPASAAPAAQGPVRTEVVNGKQRITYGVQSGDSLWALSQRFNCSVDDLRRWNKLSKRKRSLQVGSLLVIWPGEKLSAVVPPQGG